MINTRMQEITERMLATVEDHYLGGGAYARYLWQDKDGTRKMGPNEYGCADAANILYTVGALPKNAKERAVRIAALQAFQNPESGLFSEGTHHFIHCTAHCIAALELFDALPLYPLRGLEERMTPEGVTDLLEHLDWEGNPWPQAHQGAGIYAAMILTGNASPEWSKAYFDWLDEQSDPETGISRRGAVQAGRAPAFHHLNGYFHYMFNYSFARHPFPYPKTTVDTCLALRRAKALDDLFAKAVGFREIDWVYAVNRASLQSNYRVEEVRAALEEFAEEFIEYLYTLDWEHDEAWNDLHMLFGTSCALAELQQALPGKYETAYPLRLVLDRRPFI